MKRMLMMTMIALGSLMLTETKAVSAPHAGEVLIADERLLNLTNLDYTLTATVLGVHMRLVQYVDGDIVGYAQVSNGTIYSGVITLRGRMYVSDLDPVHIQIWGGHPRQGEPRFTLDGIYDGNTTPTFTPTITITWRGTTDVMSNSFPIAYGTTVYVYDSPPSSTEDHRHNSFRTVEFPAGHITTYCWLKSIVYGDFMHVVIKGDALRAKMDAIYDYSTMTYDPIGGIVRAGYGLITIPAERLFISPTAF
ncbi:MAG: hypothetical protein NTY46_12240 [Candidatus Sumerlaeota bacterium]|nr:hypothetical protein [Candidatus Sumerlaeota bacterium]